MKQATYSLRELSEATGVEPRTIRWYISEGLVRAPEGRGRAAFYTEEHRLRLENIMSMKAAGLSLRDIRKRCQMAGDDEEMMLNLIDTAPLDWVMRDSALGEGSEPSGRQYSLRASKVSDKRDFSPRPASEPSPSDPAYYRARARQMRETMLREAGRHGDEVPDDGQERDLSSSPPAKLKQLIQQAMTSRKVPRKARGELQYVIDITPEVGLVLRGEYDRSEQVLFEELADHLREWLMGGAARGETGQKLGQESDEELG